MVSSLKGLGFIYNAYLGLKPTLSEVEGTGPTIGMPIPLRVDDSHLSQERRKIGHQANGSRAENFRWPD
jgi:hypothetical protein